MADNSLYTLADKRYVFPPPTNHKEDIIKSERNPSGIPGYTLTPKTREAELIRAGRELKVAFTVMARHPEILREYACAVKEGVPIPPEPVEHEHESRRSPDL